MSLTELFSISDKVALVTGGTQGIGYMIAQGLVENGAVTYIVGRDREKCETSATALSAFGTCRALPGDISTNQGIISLLAEFGKRELQLDILVNNAGIMNEAPLAEFSEQDWDTVLDVNLKAAFFMTQSALPYLKRAATGENHAAVINIGSIGGRRIGPKQNFAYVASKAGLHHLSGSLARWLGPEHITVNAIAPGLFESAMTPRSPEVMQVINTSVPCRRLGGPEDIAGTVIYLASRAGGFTNGAVVTLDGGMLL